MLLLKGIPASPGIAIGTAFVYTDDKFKVETPYIEPGQVNAEVARFNEAIEATYQDLEKIEKRVTTTMGHEYAVILNIHKTILHDPTYNDMVRKKIRTERMSAENALFNTLLEVMSEFEKIKDEFFRERRNDVYDVAKRLFAKLSGHTKSSLSSLKTPSIVFAHNLLPSDTLSLKEHAVMGFATDIGGKTSHTALLAQSMEIPAVVAMSNVSSQVKTGALVILDGEKGLVIIEPDFQTLTFYKQQQKEIEKHEKALKVFNTQPNETKDGRKVNLMLNFDPRTDSKDQKKIISDGLGLLRTEFLYLGRPDAPSEKEQTAVYIQASKKFAGRPLNIRLADLGGDKAHELNLDSESKEENPFMGLRGVRLLLKYKELLRAQLKAIIKTAAQENTYVRIIVPMVSSAQEVREVKKIFNEELAGMDMQNIRPKNKIDFGIMVEVPSAAMALDTMLDMVDFVSIGTNDLIQYMIAVDRVNQNVAELYDPYNPAVLRMVNFIIQTAHAKNKEVSICGEMASDTNIIPILIGFGLDTLSTSPRMFLRVKEKLRNLSYKTCSNIAQAALLMGSSEDIKGLALSINED